MFLLSPIHFLLVVILSTRTTHSNSAVSQVFSRFINISWLSYLYFLKQSVHLSVVISYLQDSVMSYTLDTFYLCCLSALCLHMFDCRSFTVDCLCI